MSPQNTAGIDPRGPRVSAGITAVLLLATIVLTGLSSPWPSLVLLTVVAVGFAFGAVRGPSGTWQGWVFRRVVRPRLAATSEREDPRPPTFAQAVGLAITGAGVVLGLVAAVGIVPGLRVIIVVAAGLAFVAAFLNSAFGFCLGCEMYGLLRRWRPAAP